MVGFKANRIATVPAASLPARLRWLILTDNEIETLPGELGRCIDLQKLMLSGNRLHELPETLAGCHRLELCASPPTACQRCRVGCPRCRVCPGWPLRQPFL
jgi:Leucine-rich repeat (LRR) protein